MMRRRITKIENRSETYRQVTASQQNLVSLHKRPSGGCVRVRLCVSRCTAGPPTRQQKENEHFPRSGVRGGPASVSVIHFPLVQTPLPSVPLLCHCLQTLPAATLASMHQAQARQQPSGTAAQRMLTWSGAHSAEKPGQTRDADRRVAAVSLARLPQSHHTLTHTLPPQELIQSSFSLCSHDLLSWLHKLKELFPPMWNVLLLMCFLL